MFWNTNILRKKIFWKKNLKKHSKMLFKRTAWKSLIQKKLEIYFEILNL